MKTKLTLFISTIVTLCFLITSCAVEKSNKMDINAFSGQLQHLVKCANDELKIQEGDSIKTVIPRSINAQGKIHFVKTGDWCSGFFSGSLWLMAKLTGEKEWLLEADKFTQLLKREQWNGTTHDMGFKMMCSFGQGFELTRNPQYKEVIIQSAKTLATRFNEKVGCIRSWDWNASEWRFPVIIDNMMNLELLLKATELTGDSTYYNIAVSHANTTMKNHFRADKSSYHVVDYNPNTGEVIKKFTFQGDNDSSAWARGQAWGLYGYTMMYRETGIKTYLEQAVAIAEFILNNPNLPEDKIPVWDFNYTVESGEPKDVSAAAVMASALYDLSKCSDVKNSEYKNIADKIIINLANNYLNDFGSEYGFLLGHSVGFRHRDHEVDVPINYADYYFLEALNKYYRMNN